MGAGVRWWMAVACLPGVLLAGGARAAEPAWWTAQKQACGLSSGMAYNSWNGQCNRGGGGGGGTGLNSQQQMMLNAAQQMMPLVQQLVHNALYGDPEEAARRAQEDARIRELQQQAEEEALRNAERAKQRILAMLKSPDPYQPPVLRTGSAPATPSLALLKRGDAPAPSVALIKRGEGPDPNDAAAARAGSGFDSAGPIQGAALPPPPPTPASTPVAMVAAAQPAPPVQPAPQPDTQKVSAAGPTTPKPTDPPRGAGRDDLLKALQVKLDQNARDQKFLDELLAALERAPKPDAALLAEVRRKHAANLRALEALGEEIAAAEYDPLQDARNAPPRSSAFARGFEAATLCYSQSAGPACINAGAQQAACVADYDAGYQVGEKQRKLIMAGAYRTGHAAGAAGQLANGPADPRAEGSCRIEWIETYNRGYMQARETMTKR